MLMRMPTALLLIALTSGCSSTFKGVGVFDDYNEVLIGDITADHVSGAASVRVEAKNSQFTCSGDTRPTFMPPSLTCAGQRGEGFLQCSDGRRLKIEYFTRSCTTGWATGQDQRGATFNFVYGYDEATARSELEQAARRVASHPALPVYRPQETRREKGFATGTGFFVSHDGHLVTNFHVVDGATSISVISPTQQRELKAVLMQSDPANDIAILKVDAQTVGIPLAVSFNGAKGDEVLTLGFPLVAIQGQEQKATFGRINALSGLQNDIRFVQIDVPMQPGNSGGPLLNTRGEIIGVVTATLDQIATLRASGSLSQNVNYAVKIDYITPALNAAKVDRSKVLTPGTNGKLDMASIVSLREPSVVLIVAK